MSNYLICTFSLFCALSFSVHAAEQTVAAATAATEQDKAKIKEKKEALKEESSVTTHTITINGKPLTYTATAGTMLLKDEQGEPKASVFFVSYVKDGVTDKSKRPITFCFNGGPGSSAIWLHMGVFGPKRVLLDEIGYPILPYQSIDNEFSILDVTDLVFIDPVSTGYSRPAPGEDVKQFHGLVRLSVGIEDVADLI